MCNDRLDVQFYTYVGIYFNNAVFVPPQSLAWVYINIAIGHKSALHVWNLFFLGRDESHKVYKRARISIEISVSINKHYAFKLTFKCGLPSHANLVIETNAFRAQINFRDATVIVKLINYKYNLLRSWKI